jgi:hypothetical protein
VEARLRASNDVGAADWIAPRLGPFAERIDSLVPGGFEAYARIFHPAEGPYEARATWAEVAEWSGKVMHPHVEFAEGALEAGGRARGYEPRVGELPPDLVTALSEALARHMRSPGRCWFCVWDGGWVRGPGVIMTLLGTPADVRAEAQREWEAGWELPFGREALAGPRVRLPGRDYVLLEGPLDAAGEIGEWRHWQGRSHFEPHSPNLWWPDDRAWCVATDIDLDSTHVGGSAALVEELLGDPRLEVLQVNGADERGDRVN